ncbi:DUF6483 family protein [Enterococcus quebecensis]|uniref:Uncharacterized protein n=1 Tax=Enterococcus quebecensis TaxID=903983 RepID=A0A1E5H3B2_9ENTE|nr:DUF6483 family protein [Enterococcus quebecensis]OEG19406.1 hypothetical protein BCR23_01585 [Enterococcus quebecensis]OJG75670.1 hypothetical protein RV12_GL000009 [Enterococcus quebecensis]
MMQNEKDWFMRQIKAAVFNPFKKTKEVQIMPMVHVTDEVTGEKYSIPIQNHLLDLILKFKINEAENTLFSESENMANEQFYELGKWFYEILENLSDKELEAANFSRAEIIQGKADLAKHNKTNQT